MVRFSTGLRALVALVLPAAFSLSAADAAKSAALLQAVQRRDAPQWQALLAARAEVTTRDGDGNTALHLAARNHDLAAVTALLTAGAEVDARNLAEATPLLYGAGHAGIAQALLNRGANPNAASKLKNTPLMTAISQPGTSEAARLLLKAGADVHAVKTAGREIMLARALGNGDRPTVDLLLEAGAAVNSTASSTPLTSAAFNGDLPLVQELVRRGAELNADTRFAGHALSLALYAGHPEVATWLIEQGSDLNLRTRIGLSTPPMVWAGYNLEGTSALARAMVARGADVNTTNDAGDTALSWALRSGPKSPLVEYLSGIGAQAPNRTRTKRVPDRPVPEPSAARLALVRERLPATLAVLERSSTAFLENAFVREARCISCHGQDLTTVALELARARGLAVNDVELGRSLTAHRGMWVPSVERAHQMSEPIPDAPVSAGYGFFALQAVRYPRDEMTDAFVHYLMRAQQPEGYWRTYDRRPPMEDGLVVGAAWAALGVRDYPPPGRATEAAAVLRRTVGFLRAQTPRTHNDAVFQLLGLHWSNEPADRLGFAVDRLKRTQRADGGWEQLPGLESDAWATGTALYALHQAGGLKTSDPVYQRGVAFLLRTQFEDGSWWVRTRTWPFQPHFNGQFPHGKDQWISQGATAWAAIALLLTLEPVQTFAPPPTAAQLMATFARSPAASRRKAEPAAAASAGRIDFARDIQPVFERSCAGCHGGEKPRGDFTLASREALLKGGQSGEPSVVPGYADDSPLLHYVLGKIEDLEMPPLDRRGKYPALSAPEIETLRTWIDAGAPWPATAAAEKKPSPTLE